MLIFFFQAKDGLPALAGGEPQEYCGRPARHGGDGRHQRGHGALQDAVGRRATGMKQKGGGILQNVDLYTSALKDIKFISHQQVSHLVVIL